MTIVTSLYLLSPKSKGPNLHKQKWKRFKPKLKLLLKPNLVEEELHQLLPQAWVD